MLMFSTHEMNHFWYLPKKKVNFLFILRFHENYADQVSFEILTVFSHSASILYG